MKNVKWFYILERGCVYVGEFFILGSQEGLSALELFEDLCEEHSKKKAWVQMF